MGKFVTALILPFFLYALVGVGLHYLLLQHSSSPAPGTAAYAAVLVLSSIFAGAAIAATLNNLAAAGAFMRKFGSISPKLIGRMWKVRRRTPYNHRSPRSKVARAAYPLAIFMYLVYAAALAAVAYVFRENGWAVLPASLALLFLALIPMQVVVHGQPPAILLLGHSGQQSLALHMALYRSFLWAGCVSLLDSGQSDDGLMLKVLGSIVRTRSAHDNEWRESFRDLAAMARVVVVDARMSSPIVEEEMAWLRGSGFAKKVLLIGPGLASGEFTSTTPAELFGEISRRTGFAALPGQAIGQAA